MTCGASQPYSSANCSDRRVKSTRMSSPRDRSGGSMIFTLSNSAFYAGGGGILYVTSKHALVGMIRQLAFELAPQIRVNGVAPGATSTPMKSLEGLNSRSVPLNQIPGFDERAAAAVPLRIRSCRQETARPL